MNLDLAGYEHRFDSGLVFAARAGVTRGLTSHVQTRGYFDGDPIAPHEATQGHIFPQARIGVGYVF